MSEPASPIATFADRVRAFAANRPDAPALTFAGRTQSFADLDRISSMAANALTAAGIGRGDRVALLTRNRAEYFELITACSKIGAIVVGLNWRLSAREIAEIVADAQPSIILADETGLGLLGEGPAPCRVIAFGKDYDAFRDAADAADPGYSGPAGEVLLLLYTSGTTGLPKGVMLTNENMDYTHRLASEAWSMNGKSVNLVAMPMFHIGGCGYGSSTMLVGGHTVLMAEVNLPQMIQLIADYRVTNTFLVPAVIQALLNLPDIETSDVTSLELLMYGAAPIGDVLLRRAMAAFKCNFMHAYGMTEAAGTVVMLDPSEHDPDGPRRGLLKSCGKALPWVGLRVVKDGSDCAPGDIGEIWLKSAMIMKGYWNNPEATREAVVEDGWYRTGDAAYLDEEGHVFLVDRFKDMIISGGENIYPAEIENVLNAHPAIQEVGVIGVPHTKWGETPLAVVVPRPGQSVAEAEVIAFTRDRLAHYKCPTRVAIADTLPRNASGKLLKHEMRRIFGAPPVPVLSLARRWVNDYFNRHDPVACAAFIAPDYALEIGDVVFSGRDDEWLPAVDKQMRAFPGLSMTVHQAVCGPDWAALWFSEHGQNEGKAAVWSGVAIYRSNGRVLTGCVAQEDYFTRRRQLKSGVADTPDRPAVAPWDTVCLAPDPEAEAAVRNWLAGSWPLTADSVHVDDEHITGEPIQFAVEEVEFRTVLSSGGQVVFNVRQHGRYLGGLPGVPDRTAAAFLDCNGMIRVRDGEVVEGRVIRDRMGLFARLRAAS
ncbi:hypothetical protein CSC94_22680 [Zhengella mangrovi]|uniref:3-methylmercaptopropionyl-CoA ligase n=1 Tax=Zhengella mangrovi TaxID=1982044 RepID=A0A2G1QGV3_9HYPH|nr:AMP-binding protein [Zhengella mangrovi]PHP64742.1 hypothetical protein CSC94_22680 [Zhengella mangrovi]